MLHVLPRVVAEEDTTPAQKHRQHRVKVLGPTRQNIRRFRDILPSQSFGFVMKELNLT